MMRWIEDPASVGLRLVGLAHEVSPASYAYLHNAVEHTGWYIDNDQMETCSGVVYRLPARGRQCRYVVGVADPYNDGPAYLDLSRPIYGNIRNSQWESDDGLRKAARAADRHAERYAERERDYGRAWSAGAIYSEKTAEAREFFRAAMAIVAECGNRNRISLTMPRIAESIRDRLSDAREAIEEAWELKSGQHDEYWFSSDLREAFEDGVGV